VRERTKWVLLGILQALIFCGVVADLILSLMLWAQVDRLQDTPTARRSLPCEAIPVRFVLDDPLCADKLLKAMNVTNVRVVGRGAPVPGAGGQD
jgi:hypothetical protein